MVLSIAIASALFALTSYVDAEMSDWCEVRAAASAFNNRQLSAHIPLNLSEVGDLVYCDPAFNAWKLPVPPGMKTNDKRTSDTLQKLVTPVVSFAFGDDPFIADYRQTVWTREIEGLPVYKGEFEASHRHYTIEYCVNPDDGELYIRGRVKNVGNWKLKSAVRVRRAEPREVEVLDYHYVGFRWNAERWTIGPVTPPPMVISTTFASSAFEEGWSRERGKCYNRCPGFWGSPYTPEEHLRLYTGSSVWKFEEELAPGEEREFFISAGFADKKPAVAPLDFDAVKSAAERYWQPRFKVSAEFGNARDNDAFKSAQTSTLQLLLNPEKLDRPVYLQPCQGGTSERFYVWVWEAMAELRPMLRLGHFESVKKVLEMILSYQDSGVPPEGAFTSTKGSIGTTGPRWANTTGSALLLITDYLIYSGDEDFLKNHLEQLLNAANWILTETEATRKLNADGSKALGFGLLPSCVADDGNRGIFYATTDAWSYAGAKRFVDYLANRLNRPDAKMNEAVNHYHEALMLALETARQPNGKILQYIGDVGGLSFEFRNVPEIFDIYDSGVCDPTGGGCMEDMLRYWESNGCDRFFVDPFDAAVKYVGGCDACIANVYTQRAEWKKAYLAREIFLNYSMTRDLHITAERFSEVDQTYVPWQPNASNNGRVIELLANRFYQEGVSRLVLFGGFAPFEVARGASISGLYTRYGRASLSIDANGLKAEFERPIDPGTLVQVPDHLGFPFSDESAFESVGNGLYRVLKPIRQIR